jgi:hypothetical protein
LTRGPGQEHINAGWFTEQRVHISRFIFLEWVPKLMEQKSRAWKIVAKHRLQRWVGVYRRKELNLTIEGHAPSDGEPSGSGEYVNYFHSSAGTLLKLVQIPAGP